MRTPVGLGSSSGPGQDTRRPPETSRGRPGPRRRAPLLGMRRRRALLPWVLLAPALTVIGLLLLFPLGRIVWLSFREYELRNLVSGESDFIGFANYAALLTDPYLWRIAMVNTVVFAAVAVFTTIVVGTLVALLLATLRPVPRVIVVSCVMVAWAMPAVSGTYVWIWIFDVDNGVVAQALTSLGLLDPSGYNWFADRLFFYAVVTLNIVHGGFPFVAVTVLAGLLTVPKELHEAARIDGAGAWKRFWHVTFPVLRPVFAVVTVLSTIWDFKVFAQIYLMPGGDVGGSRMLNLGVWSYVRSFGHNDYGLGAAIAVLLTLLLLVITVFYLRALFREDGIG
ncbi:N,N'-diacetylchitobiose transport system permease protein [Nocardiopsis arvandica]|uniref:N,N'-diacetylchitobiose transport system permease protein n=2 Tax=Nocardiopsis sinuspersici TaxID=501010 RepID=A0A7Z0BJA0_9ACTN|nr:N,N'-diacetylchitobiose transport system permease protein [Nocardiopsis sinuspersici]